MAVALVETAELPLLNRAKWHKPLVSIIITHFNYSDHVEDALLSVLDQTHENWECVVVDDASERPHWLALEMIIRDIGSDKIRLVKLPENVGQIPAAFAGLDATSGEFVCILDPDDRYAETFIEEAVAGHLNGAVYCPVLSTDQYLITKNGMITGIYTGQNLRRLTKIGNATIIPDDVSSRLLYYQRGVSGWQFASTSSLMFRRAALQFMRPTRQLSYQRSADSYLAQGAFALGGGLFLTKPLVYRMLHTGNSWLSSHVFAIGQDHGRPEAPRTAARCRLDVIEIIKANCGTPFLHEIPPKPTDEPAKPSARAIRRLLFQDKRFIAKWKHSIAKWRARR